MSGEFVESEGERFISSKKISDIGILFIFLFLSMVFISDFWETLLSCMDGPAFVHSIQWGPVTLPIWVALNLQSMFMHITKFS